jgi:hypothetical protein
MLEGNCCESGVGLGFFWGRGKGWLKGIDDVMCLLGYEKEIEGVWDM